MQEAVGDEILAYTTAGGKEERIGEGNTRERLLQMLPTIKTWYQKFNECVREVVGDEILPYTTAEGEDEGTSEGETRGNF